MASGSEFLAQLQNEAEPSGFHRRLKCWVDANSETARVLAELDNFNKE